MQPGQEGSGMSHELAEQHRGRLKGQREEAGLFIAQKNKKNKKEAAVKNFKLRRERVAS